MTFFFETGIYVDNHLSFIYIYIYMCVCVYIFFIEWKRSFNRYHRSRNLGSVFDEAMGNQVRSRCSVRGS